MDTIDVIYGYIWWFDLNWISFVICVKSGYIGWFWLIIWSISKIYFRFDCKTLGILLIMGICCYEFVSVEFETLVLSLLD